MALEVNSLPEPDRWSLGHPSSVAQRTGRAVPSHGKWAARGSIATRAAGTPRPHRQRQRRGMAMGLVCDEQESSRKTARSQLLPLTLPLQRPDVEG